MWTGLVALSAGASRAAWLAPMWADAPSPPPPLPRPATPGELERLRAGQSQLQEAAASLRSRLGRAPEAAELEQSLGERPPDNPLVPGPPSILEACPPQGETPDWLWCPETGTAAPGGAR